MRLEQGIYTAVSTASPSIVADRIYPGVLPQGVTYPAITYNRVSTSQGVYLDGIDTLTDVSIQFDIWGDSLSDCHDAATALRTLLNGYQGDLGGVSVQYIKFNGENDFQEVEGDYSKARISMDFVCTLHE